MKFSIQTLILPHSSLEEIGGLARQYGYDGVEWRVLPDTCLKDLGPEVKNDLAVCTLKESVPRIQKINRDFGLEVAGFSSYAEMEQLDDIRVLRDAGCELKCPFFRIRGLYYRRDKNFHQIVEDAWRKFGKVGRLLEGYPIKAALEIHHGFTVSSCGAALHFLSKFSPEHIGIIHDPGNQVFEGREDARMGIEILGPYLAHVHFKNALWERTGAREDGTAVWKAKGTALPDGIIDWQDYIAQLKHAGYDGFLSNEGEVLTGQSLEQRLKPPIDYLRKFV
jgi:sugar phosphate isomerase/epimerase